ncbi:MAG: bacteriohemerythrin [Muribaculum sp.]|nr:bacteriohemerythrin [Muribaculum sp.]
MIYHFTEDCKIGIKEIDEEHRKLFQLLNSAAEFKAGSGASKDALNTLLKELRAYAQKHFAHEEAYMEQIGDRELQRQREEHQAFTSMVNDFDIDDIPDSECEAKTRELLAFMARWLYRHILGSDIMIGKSTEQARQDDAFTFTEQYMTGIGLIDEEHAKLFEIIRKTNDTIHAEFLHDKYDEIIHILNELQEYTRKHFKDEEQYMESIHYDGLANQQIAHEAFVKRLEELNLQEIDENQTDYLEDLIQFLLSWLSNHILRMDKLIPDA